MKVIIQPSVVSGTVASPPSKSYTHRTILVASLAKGVSTLHNVLYCDDTQATIKACRLLGAKINSQGKTLVVEGIGGVFPKKDLTIDCHASGTTLRFLTAVAAVSHTRVTLTGSKGLLKRPMEELIGALDGQGAQIVRDDYSSIHLIGGGLAGGVIGILGNTSSQFISALLLVAPMAKEAVTLVVNNKLLSQPYVDITLDVLRSFGAKIRVRKEGMLAGEKTYKFFIAKLKHYLAKDYTIEGDYTQAAYFLAAAAISNGRLSISGLKKNSKQGDIFFLNILRMMGCHVYQKYGKIIIYRGQPKQSVTIEMANYPDLVPSMAVVAAATPGKTIINNIFQLHFKETDRIINTARELKKMRIKAIVGSGSLTIIGGQPMAATIDPHGDHRLAMAFAVLGLVTRGQTVIEHAEVVNKSYPTFWQDFAKVGANLKILQ